VLSGVRPRKCHFSPYKAASQLHCLSWRNLPKQIEPDRRNRVTEPIWPCVNRQRRFVGHVCNVPRRRPARCKRAPQMLPNYATSYRDAAIVHWYLPNFAGRFPTAKQLHNGAQGRCRDACRGGAPWERRSFLFQTLKEFHTDAEDPRMPQWRSVNARGLLHETR